MGNGAAVKAGIRAARGGIVVVVLDGGSVVVDAVVDEAASSSPEEHPVTSARAVKNTPTSAEEPATRSHRKLLLTSHITPPANVTPKARNASHADGT